MKTFIKALATKEASENISALKASLVEPPTKKKLKENL
jgi:hypothetical protein